MTTVAFGPTAYESPLSFRPGVSPFSEDGGHATLTFRSRIDLTRTLADGGEVVEVFEPGNGLQFIKVSIRPNYILYFNDIIETILLYIKNFMFTFSLVTTLSGSQKH